jgi:phosphinothricin acetyltransferase
MQHDAGIVTGRAAAPAILPAMNVRRAAHEDAGDLTTILNQGIEERVATFETTPATTESIEEAIERDLVLVAEVDGEVVGWAKAGPYSDEHDYYDGVREATLYVERSARRRGVGALLEMLARTAAAEGRHKLVGKIFSSNEASIALLKALGWREVGVHRRLGCSTASGRT